MNYLKNIIIIVLLMLSSPLFGQVFTPDSMMNIANMHYQSGEYNKAIEKYEEILSGDLVSPALHYNLGNAYFKTNNLGNAILNYERGLRLSPGDEDIEYNLRIVKARTIDKIQNVPQIFLVEWWVQAVTVFTLRQWSYLVIVQYILLLISFGTFLLSKNLSMKRNVFYLGTLVLFLCIVSSVLMYSNYRREDNYNAGVLLSRTATVKAEPKETSLDAFVLHEGIKFTIVNKQNHWSEIKLDDGKIGWILNSSFEEI